MATGLAGTDGVCLGRPIAPAHLEEAGAGGGRRRRECWLGGGRRLAPVAGMAGWWWALPRAAGRYPWLSNVLLYGALCSAGDALQQRLSGGPADWRQTRCVATVAVVFHANYNYVWQRLLERAVSGRTPRAILTKVLCDQAVGAPVAISAFYTGEMPGRGSGDLSWGPGSGFGELRQGLGPGM